MTREEREALIAKNTASRARILADMAARHQRRLRGEEAFVDDEPRHRPQRTPPAVLNQGERQVRDEYERSRPVLDSATQSLWENFITAQCEMIINAKLEAFADIIGEATGQSEARFREQIRSRRAPMCKQLHDDVLKRLSTDLTTMRNDILTVLRAELGIKGDNVIDVPDFRKPA